MEKKESVLKRHNVTQKGNGRQALLFAHGFGCDQNVWRQITPAFEKDYKIILFDYIGAGKSDLNAYNPVKYSSLSGYADDVLEVRNAIDADDVIFVGHSVSGMIGALASIKDTNAFSKLIMIGPSARYINDAGYKGGFEQKDMEQLMDMMDSNYMGWAGTVAPMIMANADKPELGEELTNNFCATDPVIAKQFARVTFFSDNRKDVPKINTPCLIIQCSEDIIAPNEVGEYLHENIPGSRLANIEATGHCPHLSAPQETIEAMQSFLSNENNA